MTGRNLLIIWTFDKKKNDKHSFCRNCYITDLPVILLYNIRVVRKTCQFVKSSPLKMYRYIFIVHFTLLTNF